MRPSSILFGLFSLATALIERQVPAASSGTVSPYAPAVTVFAGELNLDLRRRQDTPAYTNALWDVVCFTSGNCTCAGKACPGKWDGSSAPNCYNEVGAAMVCACTDVCGPTGHFTTAGPARTFLAGGSDGGTTATTSQKSSQVTSSPTTGSGTAATTGSTGAHPAGANPTDAPGATCIAVNNGVTTTGCPGAPTTTTSNGAAAPTGQPREFAMAGLAGLIGVAMVL